MKLKLLDKVGKIPIDKGTALDRLLERQARLTLGQVVGMFDKTKQEYRDSKAYMNRFLVDDLLAVIEQLRTEAGK